MTKVVTKWEARRVAQSITIEGIDAETDRPVKVTNVPMIRSGNPYPSAVGRIRGFAGDQTVTLRP